MAYADQGKRREQSRRYYLANRERILENAKAYAKGHADERRARARERGYSRKYYANNRAVINAKARAAYDPDAASVKAREYKYGPGIMRLIDCQQGLCYLCSEPLDLEAKRGFHVDHDHNCCQGIVTCGRCVLGVACDRCNRGCGQFGDDPSLMIRVAERRSFAMSMLAVQRALSPPAPVQDELPIDIKRAARRREESA